MECSKLISGCDFDIHLVEARLIKSARKLCLSVESSRLLSIEQMNELRLSLASSVSKGNGRALSVDVTFTFPNIDDELNHRDSATDTIMGAWREDVPVLRPVLEHSRLTFNDGMLVLSVPSRATALLENSYIEGLLKSSLKRLYNMHVGLWICPDEELTLPEAAADDAPLPTPSAAKKPKDKPARGALIMGRPIKKPPIRMCDVTDDMGSIIVRGSVESLETRERRNGGCIVSFSVSDKTNTIPAKLFLEAEQGKAIADAFASCMKANDELIVRGNYRLDGYSGEMQLIPFDIERTSVEKRRDTYAKKRVELHLHTQFSSMDALLTATGKQNDAVETAARWGHKAVAITDHGVVHGFPSAYSAAKKAGIKVIYGVEGYLLDDSTLIDANQSYVSVGVIMRETAHTRFIYEVAAVRFDKRGILDTFSSVIAQPSPVGDDILRETCMTRDDFAAAPSSSETFNRLRDFIGDSLIVSHGSTFVAAIVGGAKRCGIDISQKHVDTEALFHYLHREAKDTSVSSARAAYGIEHNGGRALQTALDTQSIFERLLSELESMDIHRVPYMHGIEKQTKGHGHGASHIVLLVKNHNGLRNLYKLVSYSHMEYIKGVPRIPRSLLMIHRDGLIVGSACEAGELFRAVLNDVGSDETERIANEYDYLEIQPIGNNDFLRREGRVSGYDALRELNTRIVRLGEKLGKPVVATGDVHFLNPEDAVFRAILMASKGFSDALIQPPLYFKTTDELIEEFKYLGLEKAEEIVITNPNMIADMCEMLPPFLDERRTYAPTFDGADDELRTMAESTAHKLYGDPLPETVRKRLDKELNSIIQNGYSSLYLMAQRLVKKSNGDGYLVGSRGSVGSSFVATMAGITEVNPLPPHYVCPKCKNTVFDVGDPLSRCGIDLPPKKCDKCGEEFMRLGYEIPFEVFLGFKGDKTPDIDLNFSGEYQPVAHAYVEEMFGEGHAFRAGTISAVQEKTAYGYVNAYCEKSGLRVNNAEHERLARGCSGVKRTTGQHPGGIVIVPKELDIFDFTPIQFPADKADGNTITTHFDFHAMDDKLVKLDILGHDDPTVLRMLKDMTGIDPQSISLDDKNTLALFSTQAPLDIDLSALDCDVGSIAIPEFGTSFVRQMLMDTRPTTMEELVRISGLSHGTDVWLGNAQDLIKSGVATLSEVICTRDDIMNYLILHGCEPSMSFKTMENVRKGKGLTPEMEAFLRENNIPEWFETSCKKIKYMFPRAHAAAYVMMAFRVAYYKVYYPKEFYSVYFTVRADAFDIRYSLGDAQETLKNIRTLEGKGDKISQKEKDLITVLEVVYEMKLRGIRLLPITLNESAATNFRVERDGIRPPFSAIPGVGENAAIAIAHAVSENKSFTSVEDFARRSKANASTIDLMRSMGMFEGLGETDQISMFG